MSEFKGTKGKWYINRWGNVVSENQEVAYMPSLNSQEIKDANAILISKAPEMLEMLKYAVEALKVVQSWGATKPIIERIEQLIVETTEL